MDLMDMFHFTFFLAKVSAHRKGNWYSRDEFSLSVNKKKGMEVAHLWADFSVDFTKIDFIFGETTFYISGISDGVVTHQRVSNFVMTASKTKSALLCQI